MNVVGTAGFARTIGSAALGFVLAWGAAVTLADGAPPSPVMALTLLCIASVIVVTGREQLAALHALGAMTLASAAALLIVRSSSPLEFVDAWATTAVCVLALLVVARGWAALAWAGVTVTVGLVWVEVGYLGLATLGMLNCALLVGAVVAGERALDWFATRLQRLADTEREAIEWRAAQDAYQVAHQGRIEQTGRLASAMLHQIVDADGRLDHEHRVECRLLHQAIRDETRGRLLLNDAVREQVMLHRRRGAVVQLLDDGDLEDLDAGDLDRLLDQVAESLAPLRSDRLIIRSAARDAEVAITVVATSSDPIAAALGMDDDEQVDLWLELPRPLPVGAAR